MAITTFVIGVAVEGIPGDEAVGEAGQVCGQGNGQRGTVAGGAGEGVTDEDAVAAIVVGLDVGESEGGGGGAGDVRPGAVDVLLPLVC